MVTKAVLLAAGRGTRMQQSDPSAPLSDAQRAAANSGIKALIPVSRPFLDYVLTALADAGCRQVCLVVGPHYEALYQRYARLSGQRLEFSFAEQQSPFGTAHALTSASEFVGQDDFLMINSDNYYPVEPISKLLSLNGPGLVGFERDGLLEGSNIPASRIAHYALVETNRQGFLQRIIEKPEPEIVSALPEPLLVSMNCWRFGPEILDACRSIEKSPRGEFELPDAVQYSMQELGRRYNVVRASEPVLDLSCQADIVPVADRLKDKKVNL